MKRLWTLLEGMQGHTARPQWREGQVKSIGEGAEDHDVPTCLQESTERISNRGLLVMSLCLGSLLEGAS